jgi:ABC-2 type transport system ATP-binding protein
LNAHPIIQFQGLSKTFGRGRKTVQAVRELDLAVDPGQVYGFLGRNGAGKTTTIRLLLGLIRPTRGRALIRGQETRDNPHLLRRVGSLVEDPTFYSFLSGRDNLRTLVHTAGGSPGGELEELLERVGLAADASRAVGGYSKGMRQRLGLAAALLGDPELVILDEPTNGLDPGGIQEMRRFIRQLVEEGGKTIFLSSHLLNEVEQICDRVAILHQGQIVREGRVSELLAGTLRGIHLQASPPSRALEALRPLWAATELSFDTKNRRPWIEVQAGPEQAPEIVRRLVEAGVEVHQVLEGQSSLEELFLQSTGEEASHD